CGRDEKDACAGDGQDSCVGEVFCWEGSRWSSGEGSWGSRWEGSGGISYRRGSRRLDRGGRAQAHREFSDRGEEAPCVVRRTPAAGDERSAAEQPPQPRPY
ncbi:unnamed protein product, partial [Ectocarpus sp. 12 AP-2014]